MVLQTWKESHTGSRKQECPVCTPLVYLWDPGDGCPGEQPASENLKFSSVLKLIILATYGIIQLQVLHGIYPNSTVPPNNNNSNVLRPMSRTHVQFPDPLFNESQ
jgi:hypothetical protein